MPRLAAILVTLMACGSPARRAYVDDLVALETAEAQGRVSSVLDLGSAMLQRADSDADRCPVYLAMARALRRAGRDIEALHSLAEVNRSCAGSPDTSAEGLLELAMIVGRGSHARSVPFLRRVVTLFPDAPAARRAVVHIEEALGRDSDAVLETLRLLHLEVRGSAVAPFLLFEAARAWRARGGDAGLWRALALYSLLLREHPDSGLADDARLEAAAVATRLGRHIDAVRFYLEILASRETSWFFGDYDTPCTREAARRLPEALACARAARR